MAFKKGIMLILAGMLAIIAWPHTAMASANERYTVLMLGDEDEHVRELQEALHEQEYLLQKPTGYFGTDTQKAVISFQKDNDLEQDGRAGTMTRQALLGDKFEQLPEERRVSSRNVDYIYPGDEGEKIMDIQKRLKNLGYYNYGYITQYYGPITVEAVLAFQKAHSLEQDGIVGKQTNELLFSSKAKKKSDTKKEDEEAKPVDADTIIDNAQKHLGKDYRLGASGPDSFDAPGFVTYVFKQSGMSIPRSASAQSQVKYWEKIESTKKLRQGDLVFFGLPDNDAAIGHVGIYMGSGKFIHSQLGSGVSVSSLESGYFSEQFKFARRAL